LVVWSKNSSEAPRCFTRRLDGNNATGHQVSRGIAYAARGTRDFSRFPGAPLSVGAPKAGEKLRTRHFHPETGATQCLAPTDVAMWQQPALNQAKCGTPAGTVTELGCMVLPDAVKGGPGAPLQAVVGAHIKRFGARPERIDVPGARTTRSPRCAIDRGRRAHRSNARQRPKDPPQ
jgi:hypothetical protein